MPIVQIELLEGRNLDQRRLLAEKVTNAICESLDVKPESVRIIMREMKRDSFARSGKLVCDE
ncbi:MAG: 2-hydroxymuconate tautomerase [bacterium]|jgi:4-oxalocrotonate tautomerase